MKLAEALELLKDPKALRIRAAELDGWQRLLGDPWKSLGVVAYMPPWFAIQDFIKCGEPAVYDYNLPAYEADDACTLFTAEHRLGLHDRSNTRLRVQWVNYLHDLMGAQPGCPVNKVGTPVVSDIDKLLAPVEIRCAAFVMAAEWKAKQEVKA